jgi:YfiH family protein
MTTVRAPATVPAVGKVGFNLARHVADDAAAVTANRRALAAATGVTEIQWLEQVHGVGCVEAGRGSVSRAPAADAVWTRETGLGVAVLTADCVPIVLGHRAGDLVGVAHGGWRGLLGGVLEALLAALPAPSTDFVAWLGPAIGGASYEVGADVAEAVAGHPLGKLLTTRCLRPASRPVHWWLDLFEVAALLLTQQGVAVMATPRLDTFTDPRFYSFRREGATGRMATLAWLR